MAIKYISKNKEGKWKVSTTKTGRATKVLKTQKEAVIYAATLKDTEAIMVKRTSGEWTQTSTWDRKMEEEAAVKVVRKVRRGKTVSQARDEVVKELAKSAPKKTEKQPSSEELLVLGKKDKEKEKQEVMEDFSKKPVAKAAAIVPIKETELPKVAKPVVKKAAVAPTKETKLPKPVAKKAVVVPTSETKLAKVKDVVVLTKETKLPEVAKPVAKKGKVIQVKEDKSPKVTKKEAATTKAVSDKKGNKLKAKEAKKDNREVISTIKKAESKNLEVSPQKVKMKAFVMIFLFILIIAGIGSAAWFIM